MDGRKCQCPVCRNLRDVWDVIRFACTMVLMLACAGAIVGMVWVASCLMGGN